MTKQEIGVLIATASQAFPGIQQKDLAGTAQLWLKLLNDIPFELAERALAKVLMTAKFFPTIAEIREAAMNFSTNELASPEEAWGEVRKYISSGINSIRYQYGEEKPTWSNHVIAKTVDQIGLREMFESENIDFLRGQFMKIYQANFIREKDTVINGRVQALLGNVTKMIDYKEQ